MKLFYASLLALLFYAQLRPHRYQLLGDGQGSWSAITNDSVVSYFDNGRDTNQELATTFVSSR